MFWKKNKKKTYIQNKHLDSFYLSFYAPYENKHFACTALPFVKNANKVLSGPIHKIDKHHTPTTYQGGYHLVAHKWFDHPRYDKMFGKTYQHQSRTKIIQQSAQSFPIFWVLCLFCLKLCKTWEVVSFIAKHGLKVILLTMGRYAGCIITKILGNKSTQTNF